MLRDIIILSILFMMPFLPWKRIYEASWSKVQLWMPGNIEEFDILLRKRWPTIQSGHLFFFSFLLATLSIVFYLISTFVRWSTLSPGVTIFISLVIPFLAIYILKPTIESSFLFEVRQIYSVLRTQIVAGAHSKEAMKLAVDTAEVLKTDLEAIQLAWGGDLEHVLQNISKKYATDELNILLSLIREMNVTGTSSHKNVLEAFDDMKEMLEKETVDKELANDEKEMEYLEISTIVYVIVLILFMVLPVVMDTVNRLNQLH